MAYSMNPSLMSSNQLAKFNSINGFDQVIKNLHAEIIAIEGFSRKGLILAAKHIQRDCEKTAPTTPIDLGNLRSSWQTHFVNSGFVGSRMYGLRMGYAANYALWVHEMIDADFKTSKRRYNPKRMSHTKDKNTGAKWFEKSINRNHEEILTIIHANTKIP
jgi:hypothetical protein